MAPTERSDDTQTAFPTAQPISAASDAAVVVVGSGPIGRSLARSFVRHGQPVILISRSGRGPSHPQIDRRALDARDGDELAAVARDATAIVNCASPAYHRWPEEWPALTEALVTAAERSGVPLVNLSNLYAYGPADEPLRPDRPLAPTSAKATARAQAWATLRTAHQEGRIRAAEVRASDFVGPETQSHLGDRIVPKLLAGKACQVLGDPDAPHAWSYREDVAETLRAAATNETALGRVWHAPVCATRSQREAIGDLADLAGVPPVKVGRVPRAALTLLGLVNRDVRELRHILYQFEEPFLVDDRDTRELLGVAPTPWDEVLHAIVGSYRDAAGTARES